jgi:hypothetical protein
MNVLTDYSYLKLTFVHIFIQGETRAEEYKVIPDALEKHKNSPAT